MRSYGWQIVSFLLKYCLNDSVYNIYLILTGLIKLKDSTKPSSNIVKPPHKNVWPFKKHKLERDPIERLVKEASRDFETVYVSQLCLSWEMLHWQYTKLLEFDSHAATTYQYNLVAGEFQLFQVLLQRFVENEPFQSLSRVETYLKNRHHFHNFLQIPLVRGNKNMFSLFLSLSWAFANSKTVF